MNKQVLSVAAGVLLAVGIGAGCGKSENKITWLESTGTITKSVQTGDAMYTWTMEIATEAGPVTVTIPGPGPGILGGKVKLKYNQADPTVYNMLGEIK
jgi:hypothetical protein